MVNIFLIFQIATIPWRRRLWRKARLRSKIRSGEGSVSLGILMIGPIPSIRGINRIIKISFTFFLFSVLFEFDRFDIKDGFFFPLFIVAFSLVAPALVVIFLSS